jgi:hypothetical protein
MKQSVDLIVINETEYEPAYDWMHPIKMFLENQPLSDDNAEVALQETMKHSSVETNEFIY